MNTPSSPQTIAASGVVTENLPNTMFRVRVDTSADASLVGQTILCTIAGKMRMNWVRLLPGDKVTCEVSSLDKTKGRVTYKNR